MDNSSTLSNAIAVGIARANNRAKVITSLDAAYGGIGKTITSSSSSAATSSSSSSTSKSKSNKTSTASSSSSSSSATTPSTISGPVSSKKLQQVVESLIGRQDGPSTSSSVKDFGSLSMALENKSLVLDNSKKLSDASKAIIRIKRMQKRNKIVSRSFLKRKSLCDPADVASLQDLVYVHNIWRIYIRSAVTDKDRNLLTGLQFQARFETASKLGAKVIVVESKEPKLVGLFGVLTLVNSSNYYITTVRWKCQSMPKTSLPHQDNVEDQGQTRIQDNSGPDYAPQKYEIVWKGKRWWVNVEAVRVAKDETILGVYIPSQQSDAKVKGKMGSLGTNTGLAGNASVEGTTVKGATDMSKKRSIPETSSGSDEVRKPSEIQPARNTLKPDFDETIDSSIRLWYDWVDDLNSCEAEAYDKMCLLYGKGFDKYATDDSKRKRT